LTLVVSTARGSCAALAEDIISRAPEPMTVTLTAKATAALPRERFKSDDTLEISSC